MRFTIAHAFVAANIFDVALTTPELTDSSRLAKVSTVYEFPNGTWLENIDQRCSGEILTTELYTPRLWQVDPKRPATQTPVLIANIKEKNALLGITEIADDIFAVVGGNVSDTGVVPQSFSIFKVDLNKKPFKYNKLADLPDAKLLNGLTFIPGSSQKAYPKGFILGTDTYGGAIWSIDPATSKVERWAEDYLMRPCDPAKLGVNGIKFNSRNNRVYFTNTQCEGGYLASIPLDAKTGRPAGPATVVGGKSQSIFPDDFDLDPKANTAYVSGASTNQIYIVDLETGKARVFAGVVNSSLIAQPTAVKIGRTEKDKKRGLLYVSTAGMVGDQVYPGQVLAIQK